MVVVRISDLHDHSWVTIRRDLAKGRILELERIASAIRRNPNIPADISEKVASIIDGGLKQKKGRPKYDKSKFIWDMCAKDKYKWEIKAFNYVEKFREEGRKDFLTVAIERVLSEMKAENEEDFANYGVKGPPVPEPEAFRARMKVFKERYEAFDE